MVAGRTHHPVWDPDVCLECGACRRACPAWFHEEILDEKDSLRARVARQVPFPNVDGPRAVTACVATCPLHQDVPGYVAAIARGEMDRARAIILETNPLPGVLSHVCNRSCMSVCARGRLDEAVDVRRLKGVAFEGDVHPGSGPRGRSGDEQVAVIGSGPAGLAAASVLSGAGVRTVVMERDAEPGGLLRHGIPGFDLPRDVLDADIGRILEAGVSLETGVQVDFPREIDALLSSGVRAVILATGAGLGRITFRVPELAPSSDEGPVEGTGTEGIVDVVSFMRDVNTGRVKKVDGPVVVEGEGAPAIAAARAAARLGGSPVTLVVARPRSVLATPPATYAMAESEGVSVADGMRIADVEGSARVQGVRVVRCTTSRAGGGRVVPRSMGGTRTLDAALLVSGRLRDPETDGLRHVGGVKVTPVGTIAVDPDTLAAGPRGLFAAGDVASGPRNVVEAVASGLKAARAVIRFLGEGA